MVEGTREALFRRAVLRSWVASAVALSFALACGGRSSRVSERGGEVADAGAPVATGGAEAAGGSATGGNGAIGGGAIGGSGTIGGSAGSMASGTGGADSTTGGAFGGAGRGGGGVGGIVDPPAERRWFPRGMRQLSGYEFARTLAYLLGTTPPTGKGRAETFLSSGGDPYDLEALDEMARAAVDELDAERLAAVLGCSALDEACKESAPRDFGLRAWRRPLADEEIGAFMDDPAAIDFAAGWARSTENPSARDAILAWVASEHFRLRSGP